MKSSKERIEKFTDKFDSIDQDWGNSRMRIYIATHFASLEQALEEAQQDLKFEKEVNRRVLEFLKG